MSNKFRDNALSALFWVSTAIGVGGLFGAAQNALNDHPEKAKQSLVATALAGAVAGFSAVGARMTGKKLELPTEEDISFDEIDRQIQQNSKKPTPSV